mmetsp:Transcript_5029/g.4263  ORF Transcript_5029/g.4263 Transcript_5029/m.4263 type:complete len:249 (-) Transcript_5029:31-777(-)
MRAKNQETDEQKITIEKLTSEVQSLRVLVEEKKKIVNELEEEIQKCNERIEYLVERVEYFDSIIEEYIFILKQKDIRLNQLNAFLGAPQEIETHYKAVKGDEVDEMLAQYMQDCPVPVKRLGNGFYLFGTRKIFAKIMNNKLVVRVGGGYMFISEFIANYSDPEIKKLTKIAENLGVDSIWDLDLEEIFYSKGGGSPMGSPRGMDRSPKGGGFGNAATFKKSMKGKGSNSSINGTNRAKKFNSSAIVR